VHLKENLEKYKFIRIYCKDQTQLLNLLDIIEGEKLPLYYWYPNSVQLEPHEYLESVRQVVLGDKWTEPYPKNDEPSILTLKNNGWAVVLGITTRLRKSENEDDLTLEINFTDYLRKQIIKSLEE
jgi:hypothetical protein